MQATFSEEDGAQQPDEALEAPRSLDNREPLQRREPVILWQMHGASVKK